MSFFSAPTCRTCAQRLVSTATQQVRNKSKMARKSPTISVRLLKDVPKFGRKGSIVPVARGKMRSVWYPSGSADYMSVAALKGIPASELMRERDINFRPDLEVADKKIEVDLNLLKPSHTISLLESFLPTTIQFSRATVSPTDTTIHGSISTTDIATAVSAIAAAHGDEASRVVVTPSMITFLDDAAEVDKVKTLGEHRFEIRMKGSVAPVVRSVIIAQQISLD